MSSNKQDDLWCHDCGKSVPGICKKHGGFTQVFDNDIPSRARLTCPAGLVIRQVKSENGKPAFGIFAKRIIQCRSQFGPLYGPVKSSEKYTLRKDVPSPEAKDVSQTQETNSNPTECPGTEQTGQPQDEPLQQPIPDVQLQQATLQQQVSLETQQATLQQQVSLDTQQQATLQQQVSLETQQQPLSSTDIMPSNEGVMLQSMDSYSNTADLSLQQQLVSQHYTQGNNSVMQDNDSFMTQNVSLDKATEEQLINMQNSMHPGPYGDATSLQQCYTPQQALDIVTTMSGDSHPAVSQFDQHHLSVNQDLTLQASIEAGIAPDGFGTSGLTETQLLEHQIEVAKQELHKMTSEASPIPTSGMAMSNLDAPMTSQQMQQNLEASIVIATPKLPPNQVEHHVTSQIGESTPEAVINQSEQSPEETEIIEKKLDFSYEIKIFKEDGYADLIDISDEDKCNWMMFVRPARNTAEQNVVVYQQDNHIFFVSIKPIPSNTEIKVWYSAEYAEMMGKPLLPDPEPIINTQNKTQGPGVAAKWVCSVCYDGFSAFADLEAHLCPGLPPDSRRLRGRPRKGRPKKYIKPSKTWRARLEKSRMLKAKVVDPTQTQLLAPRRRGRPPKNKAPIVEIAPPLQIEVPHEEQPLVEVLPEAKEEVEHHHFDDEEDDDDKATNEMLDEILGADTDDEFMVPPPRRRGRKKLRVPRGPRTARREPMVCPHCPETFTKEALFVIHVAEHTGVKPFICEVPECSKGFMSKFKLERHRLIHTSPRHHKCPYCDKSFNRKDHLKNHMITHDPNKKRWVCEECGKEYSYNFSYRTHKAFHDADAGRSTECGICHKPHETREELLYHLKVHSGARSVKNCTEKIHGCNECGKKFYTRKDVRRHMITHTKKKDFLCQYCPQRFGRKDHLTRHLRSSHSGDNANKPPRAPRGERKEKIKEYDKVSAAVFQALNIPREDPAVLVTSQPNFNSIFHTMQTVDGREVAVPIQLYENSSQSVINMTNVQNIQHQQHIPAQMQTMQAASLASQMQIGDQRYIDVNASAIRHPQQIIDPNAQNTDYRTLQNQVQQHGTLYIQQNQHQPQQHQQQQQQQQPQQQIIKQDANIDMLRANGVIPADYQVNRDQSNRPTVVQTNDSRQQSQTFSTLIGYMETLRFLENLPTTAQGGVIQLEGGPPTMVPIQASSYAATSINMSQQPEMQKRIQIPVSQHIQQQQQQPQHTYQPQT